MNDPLNGTTARGVATKYIEGRLSDSDAAEFEGLFRTNNLFRRWTMPVLVMAHIRQDLPDEEREILAPREAAAVRRAIWRNAREIRYAFLSAQPTPEQIRLRRLAWDGSRFSKVFPEIDAATYGPFTGRAPKTKAPKTSYYAQGYFR